MTDYLYIESRNNPRIRQFKKLKEKKHRTAEGTYLVEGFRLLEEAMKAGKTVHTLIFEEEKEADFNRYILPHLKGEEVLTAGHDVIKELSSTVNPQGIVGVVAMAGHEKEEPLIPSGKTSLFIYLDGLQDPGNLGTIIRSAHASGADGILMGSGTVDPYSEKSIRSSMGSIFYLPVHQNGEEILETLLKAGFSLAVTSLEAEQSLYREDLTGNLVIAIGNEGRGVTEAVMEKADTLLKIPMPGGAESLNAAAAASVVLFERVRQMETTMETPRQIKVD